MVAKKSSFCILINLTALNTGEFTMTKNSALNDLIAIELDARNFGFEWPHKEMIIDQAISECHEIFDAINEGEPEERVQEEIGDLLHTAISLCIFAGFDVEQTLAKVSTKFATRMAAMQELAKQRGLSTLSGQSMDFMLELWHEAKKMS